VAATTKIRWYIGGGRYENPLLDLDPDITCIDPDDVGTGYDANQYVNIEAGYTQVLRTGKDFKETVIVHVIYWFVQVFDLG